MFRRFFVIFAILSLLLCAAITVSFVKTRRTTGEQDIFSIYLKSQHARYTLRSNPDAMRILCPPSARTSAADILVAQMHNIDIEWGLTRWDDSDEREFTVDQQPRNECVPLYTQLQHVKYAELIPAFLEAMEDPDKVIAVHHFLAYETSLGKASPDDPQVKSKLSRRPDGSFEYVLDAMHVELWLQAENGWGASPGGTLTSYSGRVRIDPAQFPALRAKWHRRLDQPLAVLPYSRCIADTALLPVIWCIAWLWRIAARRRQWIRNRCPRCGYDLRATPGRCPECGSEMIG